MNQAKWKLEVTIRDPKNPSIFLTSITENGVYIQSVARVKEIASTKEFVAGHQDAVATYNVNYHEQAHSLAVAAAKKAKSEYSRKEEKE